jgi:dTDP-glucose 4,6-dehydratase
MIRALITGGCGFIGSALVRHLILECDAVVVNLDALTYAATLASVASVADKPGYHFIHGDVRDRVLLRQIFDEFRPLWVFHLAAESHVDRSIEDPLRFVQTNVLGTATLLDAALEYYSGQCRERDIFRLLHVSTDEVFGSLPDSGVFDENSPYDPSSPYSASKAGADHLVRAWHRTFGLPVIVTNCSNNYGPFQFPEKLIPLMILRACRGETLPVYGAGLNVRDWLYVEDHVHALVRVAEAGRPGRTYCVSGGAERRNIDVVNDICDIVDAQLGLLGPDTRRSLIRFVTDRPGHDLRYALDSGRVRRELGWRPRTSFRKVLERTVAWYINNRDWWQPLADESKRRRGELCSAITDR